MEWKLEAFIPQPETEKVFLHEGNIAPGDAPGELKIVMRTADMIRERPLDPPYPRSILVWLYRTLKHSISTAQIQKSCFFFEIIAGDQQLKAEAPTTGDYGIDQLRHEAPRRFRVRGTGILPGAKLVVHVPDPGPGYAGPPPSASPTSARPDKSLTGNRKSNWKKACAIR